MSNYLNLHLETWVLCECWCEKFKTKWNYWLNFYQDIYKTYCIILWKEKRSEVSQRHLEYIKKLTICGKWVRTGVKGSALWGSSYRIRIATRSLVGELLLDLTTVIRPPNLQTLLFCLVPVSVLCTLVHYLAPLPGI